MKYKIVLIISIVFLIIVSIFLVNAPETRNRYHQHLEENKNIEWGKSSESEFSSHLPLLEIITDDKIPSARIIDGEAKRLRNYETVAASVKYYDNVEKENLLTDKPVIEERSLFRIRGRSSRSFDKKGYLLKFKEEDLIENKNISLSGMTEDSEWALHGPYLDKSLIRNYLCYNISGEIMDYSPNVRFCEMFLNGDYQGLYLITEKIEYNEDGRITLTKTDPELISTSYIISLDSGSNDPYYNLNTFNNYTGKNGPKDRGGKKLEVIYPKTTLTDLQKKYIEDEISQFEKTLVSFDSADPKLGYPSFIDVDSFVDYFIINEFTMNSDAGILSTYYYKDIRGKLKAAVWDFNSAFNYYRPEIVDSKTFIMTGKVWYKDILKDPNFVDKIVKRYRKLRKTVLSDKYLLNYIDETVEFLGPAIDRNNEKWGYSYLEEYDFFKPKSRNPRNHEEAIKQLKDTVVQRGAYLDENIENLYSLSHDSVNKIFRERSGD